MRKFILTILFVITTLSAQAQCNCETINRSDGTQVTQCQSLPIAYDNTTQVGIAAASNGIAEFVSITVRFKGSATNIEGDLSILLENNERITLQQINSQLAYIGNSEVAQAIYRIEAPSLEKLSSSKIKTLSFEIREDIISTYQTRRNEGILMKQLDCM